MNIIANNVASKLFVAFVAAAMLFTLAAPSAKAATAEELQAQITALMAQIAALQGQTGGAGSGAAACTFTRSLTLGSEGSDVNCLQNYLTSTGHYKFSGGSTGYFGPVTASAVAAWQGANGISPAAGYFGPISRARYESMGPAVPPPAPGDDADDTDDTDDDSDVTLGGEASLTTFEVSDGEDADDVEEGSEDMEVAEFAIEFNNGDAMITRLDVGLNIAADANDDNDPWDNLDEVSLWVDGEEVGRVDASDEDEYLDDTANTASLRFSGLDIVAMEDEEITVIVAVSVQNNIDGVSDGVDVEVRALSMRFVDGDDVTSTETSYGDMEDDYTGASADFTIDEEGAGDDLDLASSSDEPDARTLALDENDNEEYEIFAFELDADDSDGDIDINEIVIDMVLSSTTGAIDDVVNDFRIEIDGESFNAESYVGTASTTSVTFDIDGDFTVEAGETATVVVFAEFEDMDSASLYQGVTITASVDKTDIDAEGVEDITIGGSDQNGEAQTLRSVGLSADFDAAASDTSTSGNTLTMEFVVDVTAFGEDLVLTAADFNYATSVPAGATPTINVTLDATSPADEDPAGTFTLDEGDSAEYTFTVYITTLDAGDAGLYTVTLEDVDGEIVDEALDDVANFSS